MSYLFTSESVSEGHPDKVADAISDGILDAVMSHENTSLRCACETLVTTNKVVVAGEYKGELDDLDVKYLVQKTIKNIGYEQQGFDWRTVEVYNLLHPQSADIALGTDNFGAGDQGLMFGYACNETSEYMPSAIYYSHRIVEGLTQVRKNSGIMLGPDSKSQVTMEYNDDSTVKRIAKVVCSTQHHTDYNIENVRIDVEHVIRNILPKDLVDENTEFYINPTGRFVIGGPDGDTGLTGRKIIVDTYGGYAPHGGGAFSGKDPTKVDRSAAYMMRYISKNIVASGYAQWATCQVSYAIGIKEPMSFYVETPDLDTSRYLTNWVNTNVDLSPAGIIERFNLFRPIYQSTTNYGHFGKSFLPWEQVDLFNDESCRPTFPNQYKEQS
jgi:S-adenosylmethionine synthetase